MLEFVLGLFLWRVAMMPQALGVKCCFLLVNARLCERLLSDYSEAVQMLSLRAPLSCSFHYAAALLE